MKKKLLPLAIGLVLSVGTVSLAQAQTVNIICSVQAENSELGLTIEYKSASLSQLYDWAQKQAQQSGYKTVGIYSGPLGISYNTEAMAKKKLQPPKCWADLLNPKYIRHGLCSHCNFGAVDGRRQSV